MEVRFTVPGEPTGKGRPQTKVMYSPKGFVDKKTGKTRNTMVNNVTPKKTVVYENLIKCIYQEKYKDFRFPDDAMLDMRIMAFYSIPKSATKKKKASMLEKILRPTKKPDMDNVVKAIADSLNQIAYRDDTQIVDCQCRKFYSQTPRVEVIIKQIEPEGREEKQNE